jgi:hypothetical protein
VATYRRTLFFIVALLLFLALPPVVLPAWDIAPLQFPMLIPTNGYLSETGFPIAIRNLDINFFPYAGISTTLLMYNIQGLSVTGLPTDKPIIGPSYTLLGNLCLKLMLPAGAFKITAKGGGFAFYNLSPMLMTGNLEEAIADDKGWDGASADVDFDNAIGFGWVVGGSVTYYILQEVAGIFAEVLYYRGKAPLNLRGNVKGITGVSVVEEDVADSYSDVEIDFSGIEITLGITLSL